MRDEVHDVHVPLRRNRSFARLWISQFLATLAWQVSALAFPLLVLAATRSPTQASIIGALNYATILVYLPAGSLADRVNRRYLMVGCALVEAVALGSVAVSVGTGHVWFWLLCAAALLQGIAMELFSITELSALPHIVSDEQVSEAASWNVGRTAVAVLVAPSVGGALFGLAHAAPFIAGFVACMLACVLVVGLRQPLQASVRKAAESVSKEDLVAGLKWLWRQRFLRAATIVTAGAEVTWGAIDLVIIFRAYEANATAWEIGIMIGAMGAGGVLGSMVSGRVQRKFSLKQLVIGVFSSEAVLIGFLAFTNDPYAMAVIVFVASLGFPPWNGALAGAMMSRAPDGLRGRVSGAQKLIISASLPLGVLAVGPIMEAGGGISGVVALVLWHWAVALFAIFSKSIRVPVATE
ncbi:MFS transporter [Saccharomonospora saliphila]|uniref:MFS transporter n=1 Tax=Saccharomonospora saliphila TaxID=369829 RepID=UPI000367E9C5|nr:MFS transporter [Saccharomonospora saliphila]